MIIWTFARHPVSKSWFHSLNQLPIKIGTFQFLPTGLHGLCFGYCFSGPLPLHSLTNGPLFRVRFGESLVVRLYSEIDHLHLSIEAQCVSHHLLLGDCHTQEVPTKLILKMSSQNLTNLLAGKVEKNRMLGDFWRLKLPNVAQEVASHSIVITPDMSETWGVKTGTL